MDDISNRLHIDRETVAQVIEFLLRTGLVVKNEKNEFTMGPKVTHVGHNSPFVIRHHNNWRIKALQSLDNKSEENLHYTVTHGFIKKSRQRNSRENNSINQRIH